MMNRVVVIEDEGVLRASLVRGLGSLSNLEVVGAGNLQDGLRLIDDVEPSLVLSDIDLPDRSGIEIIGELGRRGLKVPVIFMSAYLKAYGAQIPRHANVEVMEKPVALEQLRDMVSERLEPNRASDSPFSVADYLQLACMGRHSVRISADHGKAGEIVVVNGELWTAQDGEGEGTEAFRRMALSPWPGVTCEAITDDQGERTIEENWQSLLLDTARLADESASDTAADAVGAVEELDFDFDDDVSEPSGDQPPAGGESPAPKRWGKTLDMFVAAAAEAILDRRYQDALGALISARDLSPDDPRVLANLRRLTELGYEIEEEFK